MNEPLIESMRALRSSNKGQVESFFVAQETYWLTLALATGFALADVEQNNSSDDEMIACFNQSLRQGFIDEHTYQASKKRTLNNLSKLVSIDRSRCTFCIKHAMPLCTAFVSYWLFTKLMELEWQRILGRDDEVETYLFLDGVIADQEELEEIKKRIANNEDLHDDESIYLRAHWTNAREFFNRLYNTLNLLDQGMLTYHSVRDTKTV